ncbi:MAG: PEGA domain-containing protein [Muribaculaceae bacterium]|nr:PEGA domain-containing protein [Muribaculaceae bacterium]
MNLNIFYTSFFILVSLVNFVSLAKNYDITVTSDPEGATVYLNGIVVSNTTPCVLSLDKKTVTKTMIFKFEKEGYKSKSLTVSYNKNELKFNPMVFCKMEQKPDANKIYTSDPTVTVAQSQQRVDRNNAGSTDMEKTILRWFFDSDPRGARIYYRVISSVPNEVKNTNETYLSTTPYEETRGFNILGLTYDNSRDVTIEVKVSKRGFEDQVKRFNVRQALDQQEISGFFELVAKEEPQQRQENNTSSN